MKRIFNSSGENDPNTNEEMRNGRSVKSHIENEKQQNTRSGRGHS